MAQVRSWAGLDVHARSVRGVTLDGESGEIGTYRLTAETTKVVEFLAGVPGLTRVAYEAGPTGYGLARALHAAGIGCVVAAGEDRASGAGQDQDRSARRGAGAAAVDDRRAAGGAGLDRRGGGAA
jgi:transposase